MQRDLRGAERRRQWRVQGHVPLVRRIGGLCRGVAGGRRLHAVRRWLCGVHVGDGVHHVRRGAARGRGWARASRTSPSFSVPAMETVLILGILQVGGLIERPVDWRQSGAHYTVRLRRDGRRAACIFGVVGVFWKTWSTLTYVRGSMFDCAIQNKFYHTWAPALPTSAAFAHQI